MVDRVREATSGGFITWVGDAKLTPQHIQHWLCVLTKVLW